MSAKDPRPIVIVELDSVVELLDETTPVEEKLEVALSELKLRLLVDKFVESSSLVFLLEGVSKTSW